MSSSVVDYPQIQFENLWVIDRFQDRLSPVLKIVVVVVVVGTTAANANHRGLGNTRASVICALIIYKIKINTLHSEGS